MPYKNEFNMKSFFKYIAVAMAMSLLAIGCTPEILAPDQSKLPEASALDVKIDVDQTTNYVTFTVTNPGVVPMWIFGEDKVADGKATKIIVPSNIQNLATLATSLTEIVQ